MAYETIDQGTETDKFQDAVIRMAAYADNNNEDPEERLKLEKNIKDLFKVPRPDWVFNFVLESIRYNKVLNDKESKDRETIGEDGQQEGS